MDRGPNSRSCILSLLLWNLADPGSVVLNRGNHETVEMNAYYGFKKELNDDELFYKFNYLFNKFPLAHVIGDKIFCVHGGLPKKPVLLNQLDRYYDELLWNDPCETPGVSTNPRGPGTFKFGPDVTENFLKMNKLDLLVRSHEMVLDGFEYSQNGKCVTVFSASNYYASRHISNKGGYLHVMPDMSVIGHSFLAHQQSKL